MSKPKASPATRRKRRSTEEIFDRIIAAAGKVFQECGYSGATTAAIARQADVTEAQIFRLFPSKAELFREAIFRPLNRHFSEFQSRHLAAIGDAEPVRELAGRYINELQDFIAEHSGMLMSLIVANAYSPGAAERISEIDGLKAYFERGTATMSGHTKGKAAVRPEAMVRISFAAVLASVLFRDLLFPQGLVDDEEMRKAIVDFTIGGVSANWEPGW
ncbi:MAG: TetR/AcrR family transcriptional regulator [Novosphingobium sp.]